MPRTIIHANYKSQLGLNGLAPVQRFQDCSGNSASYSYGDQFLLIAVERVERPHRSTDFERDVIGRLLAKGAQDARQDYVYDDEDRLISTHRMPSSSGNKLGFRKRPSTSAMGS